MDCLLLILLGRNRIRMTSRGCLIQYFSEGAAHLRIGRTLPSANTDYVRCRALRCIQTYSDGRLARMRYGRMRRRCRRSTVGHPLCSIKSRRSRSGSFMLVLIAYCD